MIKSLRLKNFKSFEDTGTLEIKPLTILVGANSAGKSSIFQSLLLLKQTLESDDADVSLELQGDFMKISNFNDLVFRKPALSKAELIYELELTAPTRRVLLRGRDPAGRRSPPYMRPGREGESTKIELSFRYRDNKTRITRLIAKAPVGPEIRAVLIRNGMYNMSFLHVPFNEERETHRQRSYRGREGLAGAFSRPNRLGLRTLKVMSHETSWHHFLPPAQVLIREPDDGEHHMYPLPFDVTSSPTWRGIRDLDQVLRSGIYYLGPLRSAPERVYLQGSSRETIGQRGEGTIQVLYLNRSSEVTIFDETSGAARVLTLQEAVSEEFTKLGMAQPDIRAQQGLLYQVLFPIRGDKQVTIADVGFGVSQILPILVMGLRAPSDGQSLILFEQPEIHLHPRLQANIGDFFLRLAQSGRSVIVETHSEHMINRIRRRIAESPDNRLSEMVNILFVRPGDDGNGSIIEPLTINEFGSVENWPDDFFPEAEDEVGAILNASLRKRRGRRGDGDRNSSR